MSIFASNQLRRLIMTVSQMNAEISQSLSILSESEEMLARAAKYLRKLVKEQQKTVPTLMSKEEYFQKLDEAEEEYRQGKYTTLLPGESVTDMLKRCGYGV